MTEEVARRFATPNEAIKYALDHKLSREAARFLTDEQYATVERTRAAIAADAKSRELGKLGRQAAKVATVVARGEEIAALLAEPKPEPEPVAPGRALVPVHGGLDRPGFGRAAKIFSPPTQPERVDPEPEQAEAEPAKSGTGLQVEVAQSQSEFGFSPPTELPLPEAIKVMNDKHAVISNLGGKCVTMEWTPSLIMPGTKELAYQSFTSFRERYANRYVDCGMGMGRANLGAVWLAHPQRRQYEGLDLVPNGAGVLPGGYLNLWRGWGVEPRKSSWRRLQRHVGDWWQTAIRSSRITSRDGRLGNFRMQVCPPRS
jgi:hypothetical protein